MESIRESFDNLVKETLAMDLRLQIQPLSDSEEYSQTVTDPDLEENSTDALAEKSPNLSSDDKKNKAANRYKVQYTATRIKYSTTRIKSTNFLSNVSYTGINRNAFYNESFIVDVYVLLVKNLNPFSMSRKLTDKNKHEMVYMLWRECIPSEFYRYICDGNNFIYLNSKDVSQPSVFEIVANFIDRSKQNFRLLQENLARYKYIFQYVYSHVFPEVYTSTEKRGFNLKSNFNVLFKTYLNKMILRQQATAKNIENYKKEQQDTCKFEQKSIKNFDQLSDSEEQQIKERAEKRNAAQRERAEELKAKKLKLKEENNKAKEGEMWNRLAELNSEFKKIKQTKKEVKKMSSTIL